MKKITFRIILSIFFIALLNCQEHSYDPWGVWTNFPDNFTMDITTAKIRTFDDKKYYEAGDFSIRILKIWDESRPNGIHIPAFGLEGSTPVRIEKYEKTDYGFLFYTVGIGTRDVPINSNAEWRKDDTRIQIKMIFISPDECKFEYISKVDENGYSLSFLPDEGVIYRRYRVPSEDNQANGSMDYPPPVDMSSYETTHHTTDNLRLRDNSNASSEIVTTLLKGSAVQVLETGAMQTIDGITAPWVKVLSESGYTGWCFSGYLKAK